MGVLTLFLVLARFLARAFEVGLAVDGVVPSILDILMWVLCCLVEVEVVVSEFGRGSRLYTQELQRSDRRGRA